MPLSGPDVHKQLMEGYNDAQTELEELRDQVSSEKGQREDLDDQRGNALVDLAEFYLPELTRQAIQETWIEIRSNVAELLSRKEEHRQQLDDRLSQMTSRRQQEERELDDLRHAIDELIDRQQDLLKQIDQRLREDDEFKRLSDRAALAEAALERAEANLNEVEQDSAKKLPEYDASDLFRYLYDRGYGTEAYAKRGFTRRMDRWLAQYIDFAEAKKSYDFLKNTPDQMRKIIAEDRASLDTVMDELERRRDVVAKETGLTETMQQIADHEEQRDSKIVQIDATLNESEKLQAALSDLEDTRGTYYRQAIELFREMLQRSSSRDLERMASRTPEVTDDQIVSRLRGVDASVEKLDDMASNRRRQIKAQQDYLDDFGRMIQQFRSARFDSARSQFSDNLDVYEVLHEAQRSQDADYLWNKLRRAHRWGPSMMERVTDVATHPLTQVLINAMAHAAGAAWEAHARRAGERRASRKPRYRSSKRNRRGDSSDDWKVVWGDDSFW